MILNTEDKQKAFLAECYENIKRIFYKNVSQSEKNKFDGDSNGGSPEQRLYPSGKRLFTDYPASIHCSYVTECIKTAKLTVLINIYNSVTEKIMNDEVVDLDKIFYTCKLEIELRVRFCLLMNLEKLMNTHRRDFLENSPITKYFFKPTSYYFLFKYGFFEDLPLHCAIYLAKDCSPNSLGLLNSLLNSYLKKDIEKKEWYGFGKTPLQIAIREGMVEAVKVLINHGAIIDASTLKMTIQMGNLKMMSLLLKNNVNVNEKLFGNRSMLQRAIDYIFSFNNNIEERIGIVMEILKREIDWSQYKDSTQEMLQGHHDEKTKLKNDNPFSYCTSKIEKTKLNVIHDLIIKKRSEWEMYAEVRKNARLFGQAIRQKNTLFSKLPFDLIFEIFALIANADTAKKNRIAKFASSFFSKPVVNEDINKKFYNVLAVIEQENPMQKNVKR